MQDSLIKPQFELHVYGDWSSIIGVREYRDALIDQKPFDDEDSADYSRYRIKCETAAEMVEAYEAFRTVGACEFAVSCKSEEIGAECFATTGTGYGSKPPWFCKMEVDETRQHSVMAGAIRDAISILSKTA